ncbi:uncharacterized protein L201_001370 [Kwoniella dendrophila CBS 6074]|uniref:YtxH domain-containing protein n=1 Tax=Kwoniella dendrophila CBS 6074 TaxID=1295534 RepID=A0AAX4JNP0_9TREE
MPNTWPFKRVSSNPSMRGHELPTYQQSTVTDTSLYNHSSGDNNNTTSTNRNSSNAANSHDRELSKRERLLLLTAGLSLAGTVTTGLVMGSKLEEKQSLLRESQWREGLLQDKYDELKQSCQVTPNAIESNESDPSIITGNKKNDEASTSTLVSITTTQDSLFPTNANAAGRSAQT